MRLDEAVMTRGRLVALQVIAVGGAGLNSLIPMAVSPALPAMALHFDGSGDGEFVAKLVMASPALATAIVSPFVGMVAQRFGFRLCLLAALLVFAVAGSAGMALTAMEPLIATRIAIGVAGAFIGTITIAMAALFDPALRDRLIGFASALGGGSAILALSVGGALVDARGWQAPFVLYLAAVPFFLAAIYSVRLRPREAAVISEATDPGGAPFARLMPIYLLMLVMAVGFFTPGVQGPFLLAERGVASAATQGMLLSIFAAMSAITSGSFGFLRPRLGERCVKALMLLSIGGGLAGMAVAPSIAWMGVSLLVAGIGSGLATPQITAMLIERVPPHAHAHAIGGMYAAIFLGQFLNPFLLDPIRALIGLPGMFGAFGLALVAGGCVMGLVSPKRKGRAVA
jgi:MFS family permease